MYILVYRPTFTKKFNVLKFDFKKSHQKDDVTLFVIQYAIQQILPLIHIEIVLQNQNYNDTVHQKMM